MKEEYREEFIKATIDNCKNSLKEPGITRFDFLHSNDNLNNFILVEIYNNPNANVDHKATIHYNVWAKTVADMMERPRFASKYATLYPSPLFYH